jgi:hypothetical protein
LRISAFSAVLAGALLLIWPAFFNGYPLLFSDSGGFLHQTLGPLMLWDKPYIYGPFLHVFHWRISLWGPVIAQGLILSHLLWLTQRVLCGNAASLRHMGLCAFAALATAAPFSAALLMPDVFAPIVVLGLFLLGFGHAVLTRFERAYLVALVALGIAAHLAHLPLALGLCGVALLLRLWRYPVRILAMALPVALAVAVLFVTNAIGHGRFALSPYGSVFMLARLQEDGPASAVLKARCPDAGWYLCAFTDRLPMPANDFLWAPDSPVNRDAAGASRFLGGAMLAPEAGQIVAETLRADPLGVARAMVGNMLLQLGSFGIGDTLDNAHFASAVRPRIEQGFSARELAAFDQARQARDVLKEAVMPPNLLHLLVVLLALPLLLWSAWRGQGLALALALFVLAAVLGNALICGGLSAPHPRYGARIMWLLPVAAAMQILLPTPNFSVSQRFMHKDIVPLILKSFLFIIFCTVLLSVLFLVALHLFKVWQFSVANIDCAAENSLFCFVRSFFISVSPKLRDWQDLSAGFLAVGAALLGIFAVLYQTQVTKRLEEAKKMRRAEALRRGLLPSVLSNLADFCEKEAETLKDCFEILTHKASYAEPSDTVKSRLGDNDFEKSFVEKMLEIIEFSDEIHQKNLIVICGNLQIYESRKRMLKRPSLLILESSFVDLGVLIVDLHARCYNLFPVARATDSRQVRDLSSNIAIDDLKASVFLLGFVGAYEERLIKWIEDECREASSGPSLSVDDKRSRL